MEIIKKVVQLNKYGSTIVNIILIRYIEQHKVEVLGQNKFNELVEVVFNASVV